jgi:hypothetical protein
MQNPSSWVLLWFVKLLPELRKACAGRYRPDLPLARQAAIVRLSAEVVKRCTGSEAGRIKALRQRKNATFTARRRQFMLGIGDFRQT